MAWEAGDPAKFISEVIQSVASGVRDVLLAKSYPDYLTNVALQLRKMGGAEAYAMMLDAGTVRLYSDANHDLEVMVMHFPDEVIEQSERASISFTTAADRAYHTHQHTLSKTFVRDKTAVFPACAPGIYSLGIAGQIEYVRLAAAESDLLDVYHFTPNTNEALNLEPMLIQFK